MAIELNAQCPQDLGDGVRMDSVRASNERLMYHYTLTDVEKADFTEADIAQFTEEMKSETADEMHSDRDTMRSLKAGVDFYFYYNDMHGERLLSYDVSS